MVRNRMPLRNLLVIVLMAIIFFMSCLSYQLSLESYRNDEERWVLAAMVLSIFVLSLIASGIWMKKNGARVFLLVILYLMGIGWTIFAGIWFVNMRGGGDRISFMLMPFVFTFCFYFILFSFITFLNNPKLKEEFGIKEED